MTRAEMGKSPAILLVTDIDFWQQSFGSHTRIIGILNALSDWAEVDVLVFRPVPPAAEAALRRLAPAVRVFTANDYPKAPPVRRPPDSISGLAAFSGKRQEGWVAALAAHLAARPARAVIVEYLRLGYLLDAVPPGVLRVLDLHDVMAQRRISFAHFGRVPSIVMPLSEEIRIIDAFDIAIAITAEDAAMLAPLLRRAMLVVTPHVGATATPPADQPGEAGRVLFIGADTPPNRDGLTWFLRQVWPAIPNTATLHVAGDISRWVKTAPRGVSLLGRLPDLAAFYAGGQVAINPVHFGGGMKIKTLEAVQHNVPVVTTREGARGMLAANGRSLRIADTRSAFVGHLRHLLADDEARHVARQACIEDAHALFSPREAMAQLNQALGAALG